MVYMISYTHVFFCTVVLHEALEMKPLLIRPGGLYKPTIVRCPTDAHTMNHTLNHHTFKYP